MIGRSFKQIRLALPFLPALSGTGAAGPCRMAFANDNAWLRLCPVIPNRVLRLAGRFALAQLRAIYQSGRTVSRSFSANSFLMCQRIPGAVTVIASAYPFPSFVRHRCLCVRVVEFQSTTGDFAGVGQSFSDLRKGASHDRRD